MRHILTLALSLLSLAVSTAPAAAQQRLFALTDREIVEVDPSPAALGRVIWRAPVARDSWFRVNDPTPVAGGAFIAWASVGGVAFLDTRTGAIQQYALPGFIVERILGTDPASYQVMVRGTVGSEAGVVVADLKQLTTRVIGVGAAASVADITYAPGLNALFVAKSASPFQPASTIDIVDVADGSLASSFSIAPLDASAVTASRDGSRLFVTTVAAGTYSFATQAGTIVGANPLSNRHLAVDDVRGRVLVDVSSRTQAILAGLSSDSLDAAGSVVLPALKFVPLTGPPNTQYGEQILFDWDVSPLSATIYALESVRLVANYFGISCSQATWVAVHAGTGVVRAVADGSAVVGRDVCRAELVRLTEPAAPRAFAATVTGRHVSFTWEPEAATHYVLEAGVSDGRTDLTIPVSDTSFSIDGVPPGVYHVRVRAVNVVGKGAASQELRVVVE